MENLTLCVPRPSSKKDPHSVVLCRSSIPSEIPANHILIRVDRFGFSANNVTYQALGEAPHFRYFEFHAAPKADGVSPEIHGVIPVWGFGDIVASNHPRIAVGERVYGYFAPTKYLLVPVSPSDVNKYSFFIPRPHLPVDRRPYNQVIRCATDAQYDPSPLVEDMTMLYRPLFWTAFWCEDWLHASQYRGASNFLISSASAKTAFCLAYLLQKRADSTPGVKKKVVGLTSKRNIAFTEGLKLYDEVVSYDAFVKMGVIRGEKWLYVDVAGNDELNARVHNYLNSIGTLVAGVQLGLTNLSPSAPTAATTKFTTNTALAAPPPSGASGSSSMEQFFMPEWLAVRRRQLSVDRITSMQAEAWHALMKDGRDWVRIERVNGGPAVAQAYRDMTQKGTDPRTGMIWSLWDSPEIERAASTKL